MPDYIGSNGAIDVGSAVGQLVSFSLSQSNGVVDNTVMGSSWKDSRAGMNEWSGQMEVLWDPSDAGQDALYVGAEIDGVKFRPQGNSASNSEFTGGIIVSSAELPVSIGELIKQTVSFSGRGALVEGVIA